MELSGSSCTKELIKEIEDDKKKDLGNPSQNGVFKEVESFGQQEVTRGFKQDLSQF